MCSVIDYSLHRTSANVKNFRVLGFISKLRKMYLRKILILHFSSLFCYDVLETMQ